MPHDFQADIDAIGRIDAVPTILDVVCRTTGMGFAAVARVTEDRWIVCGVLDKIAFGLEPGGELKVATTICNEIRQSGEPVIIDNVTEDDAYCGHPTPAMYGFQSYISMPIRRGDGRFFGTLCAIDPRPARLKNPETIGMFKLFAELIAAHLDANEELVKARADLVEERSLAELREQFVAVLGHDLRNPIASIASGVRVLQRMTPDDKAAQILSLMRSSVHRMSVLIDDVLDFARTKLGGGLMLRADNEPLQPVLEQVVEEARAVRPGRRIDTDFSVRRSVVADHSRLARLFANLLNNALVHGAENTPVSTGATIDDGVFELWVANAGAVIPAEIMDELFRPFVRGKTKPTQEGLGLGLFIASEIARGHGGTLTVASTTDETRFTFRLPL